jgi:hypothetical protein
VTTLTLALVIALAVIVLWLVFEMVRLRKRVAAVPAEGGVFKALEDLDADLTAVERHITDMRPRLDAVEDRLPQAIQHTAVIAYDAFGDIAGRLSRSIALLNGLGDGVVVSLLVGRDETRWFTKSVRSAAGVEPLSPEEQEAVRQAMSRA